MATVIQFPPAQTPRPAPPDRKIASRSGTALPATAGKRGEYALGDLARSLGLAHKKSIRTIIDTLRALARDSGMPLPRTPRVLKKVIVRGPLSICKDSRWDAGEIDAWLDGRGPSGPAAAACAPRPLAPPLRAECAERARQIGAGR